VARYNYFVGGFGDFYSEWHRNKCNDIAYIDIDSVPICINKPCWKPLAVIETVDLQIQHDKVCKHKVR